MSKATKMGLVVLILGVGIFGLLQCVLSLFAPKNIHDLAIKAEIQRVPHKASEYYYVYSEDASPVMLPIPNDQIGWASDMVGKSVVLSRYGTGINIAPEEYWKQMIIRRRLGGTIVFVVSLAILAVVRRIPSNERFGSGSDAGFGY